MFGIMMLSVKRVVGGWFGWVGCRSVWVSWVILILILVVLCICFLKWFWVFMCIYVERFGVFGVGYFYF